MEQENHSASTQIDVMIVDDMPENLILLTDILKNHDYSIRLATSAEIALRSIKAKHPFIILLDVQLPGMDGYELCKLLKADDATKRIPVIFLTVHSSSENKMKAFESGGVDYIAKPILVEEVLARVDVHVQLRKALIEEERIQSLLYTEIEEHRRDKFELLKSSEIVNTLLEKEKRNAKALLGILKDQKEVMASLQESELRYRSVTESANEAIITADSKGIIVDWNRSAEKIFGYPQSEIIGKNLTTIIPKRFVGKHNSGMQRMEQGGEHHIIGKTMELQGRHKNEKEFPLELSLAEWKTDSENYYTGIIRDITERKNSESHITLLAHAMTSIGECVSITDLNDMIVFVNNAFCKTYGYEVDEVIGKHISMLHSSDSDQTLGKDILISTQKGRWHGELLNRKKNGDEFYIDLSTSAIRNAQGETIALIGVAQDITERKAVVDQIQKLSAAVEQSPVSVVITDTKGTIEYVNKKFIEIAGYSFDESIGKNPRILKSGETSNEEYKKLWETISSGKEWFGEFHNKKKNGELYWESAAISPIVDYQGKTTHYLALKEDITVQKEMQLQMLRSQRMESIGTLAGGIAHDLNNILGPILLSAQILRMKIHEEELQIFINTIESSTIRGKNIIAQVLGFARGVENKFILMQIRHIVKEILDVIKQTFEKNIVIQSYAAKDLWTINADPTQIHQVIMNLCVNARDAMPNGGNLNINVKNIEVDDLFRSHHPLAHKERYIEIEVRDTGSGIPPEIQQKIFDPFFTTKEVGKGTGLGLSTVYSIVKTHFGFIEMESTVGKGTVFQIYLPAATESESTVERTSNGNISQGHNESILVIDDEEPVRSTCEEALKFYNYSVVTAENGAEGIIKLIQKGMKFTVVLIDMMMPVMDGKTASAAIRKIEPTIKLIGMSGMMDESKIDDRDKTFDLFLRKPFSTQELIEAVQEVIAKDTLIIK